MFTKTHPENLKKLWAAGGMYQQDKAQTAMAELAKAVELPLRKSILPASTIDGIFSVEDYSDCRTVEYPIDFVSPGTENDYVAYTIPDCGYIPHAHIEGDYLLIPTYNVGNSIEWCVKYQRCANWNVADRALEVLRSGFVKKINDDAWHLLLAAGLDRNIVVFDNAASGSGQFTKRLVSLMQLVMRRNGGGTSTSLNRFRLTDLYVSPEAQEDMRNWNVDQVDEITRREIFTSPEPGLMRVFGVNFHTLDELGTGNEYQLYYENDLGGALPPNTIELVVGLDLSRDNAFIMPVVEPLQVIEDMCLGRHLKRGFFAHQTHGMAVVDGRAVILGAL